MPWLKFMQDLDDQEQTIRRLTMLPGNRDQVRKEVLAYDNIFAEVVAAFRDDIQKELLAEEQDNLRSRLDSLDQEVFAS